MAVPSKDQLIDHDSFDERFVIKHWTGKTIDGVNNKMLANKPSLYCEVITYMSIVTLDFHLPAAFSYLQSTDSDGDWDRECVWLCRALSKADR